MSKLVVRSAIALGSLMFFTGCGVIWGGVTYINLNAFKPSQLGVTGATSIPARAGTVRDAQGNFYIAGSTTGLLGGTFYGGHGGGANTDISIYKLDQKGNLIWIVQLGSTGFSATPYAMVLDSAGGLYMAGATSAVLAGSTQYGTHGSQDIFVAKFDISGGLHWISQLGDGAATQARGISMDNSGNLYVSGFTAGSTTGAPLFGTQYGAHGSQDLVIAQFNSSGVYQWVSQMGVALITTTGYQNVLDGSGNIYITGSSNGFLGGTQYGTLGTQDFYVAQFSTTGSFGWVSQVGVAGATGSGVSLVRDSSGSLTVIGNSNGSYVGAPLFGTQYGTHSNPDLLLAQFTSSGAYSWLSQLGGGPSHGISGMLDGLGSIYIAGDTAGYLGGTQYGSHGLTDLVITKFNTSGGFYWANQQGVSGANTYGAAIVEDGSRNFYILGQTGGFLGGVQYGSEGVQDSYISPYNSDGIFE